MKTEIGYAWCLLCLLATIVVICVAVPVSRTEEDVDSELNDDFSEDDIINNLLRGGKRAPARRWPNAVVYYKISPDFEASQAINITYAMDAIEEFTCIRFREAKPNRRFRPGYVNIQANGLGCNSVIGYQGRPQMFNLQKNITKCFKVPVIIHELLHTLGFYHEHTAPNRDDYVQIVWDNIQPGKERWFEKLDSETFSDFGYGYDYESIMHYGRTTFAVNGSNTMLPLDRKARIGQRRGLSLKDIAKINAMYKCPSDGDGDAEADFYMDTDADDEATMDEDTVAIATEV